MTALDPRLNAFRPDLADIRLKGRVEALEFVKGEPMQVTAAVADMRREPRPDSGVDTQLLFGETVDVFEEREGWCWAQAHADGYAGYVAGTAFSRRVTLATHVLIAPRTFLYPGPDMKLPVEAALSIGSRVEAARTEETRGTNYLVLPNGMAIVETHAREVAVTASDPVAVAESLLGTPYLWGGRSGHGIDCSGLVQLTYSMCGTGLQRDTSMQQNSAGREISPGRDAEELRRGDLVFWNGHVAMMRDGETIIHASGHSMAVVVEGYDEAVGRIGHMYGKPVCFRRIGDSRR